MNVATILKEKGTEVTTVGPDRPVDEVARELTERRIGAVLVTEGERRERSGHERIPDGERRGRTDQKASMSRPTVTAPTRFPEASDSGTETWTR